MVERRVCPACDHVLRGADVLCADCWRKVSNRTRVDTNAAYRLFARTFDDHYRRSYERHVQRAIGEALRARAVPGERLL